MGSYTLEGCTVSREKALALLKQWKTEGGGLIPAINRRRTMRYAQCWVYTEDYSKLIELRIYRG